MKCVLSCARARYTNVAVDVMERSVLVLVSHAIWSCQLSRLFSFRRLLSPTTPSLQECTQYFCAGCLQDVHTGLGVEHAWIPVSNDADIDTTQLGGDLSLGPPRLQQGLGDYEDGVRLAGNASALDCYSYLVGI